MLIQKLFALEAGLTLCATKQISGGVNRLDVVPQLGAGEEGRGTVLAVEVGEAGVTGEMYFQRVFVAQGCSADIANMHIMDVFLKMLLEFFLVWENSEAGRIWT